MKLDQVVLLFAALLFSASSSAEPLTLVRDGRARAVIVVPGPQQTSAVADLRDYVEKATGARLDVVDESKLAEDRQHESRIYLGACRAAKRIIDPAQLQPEGFIIKTVGNDLYIVGRDSTDAGMEVNGTQHGVSEFLERFVGVRWLVPGPLGEVVPKRATLEIPSVDIRQEPILWQRKMREVRTVGHRTQVIELLKQWEVPLDAWEAKFGNDVTGPWCARQRLGSRFRLEFGHSYDGWWDKYHEQYPNIFALQPNGTRVNTNTREQLCVSNPVLWDLVAKDRIDELRTNTKLAGVSIAPNDGGGGNRFCCCEQCRSWDSAIAQALYRANPKTNQGPGGEGPFPPLSDRYFRFFNEVARRVKAEFPDRYLGTIAYSAYKKPPKSIGKLEDNLIVGYVGPNDMVNDKSREEARRDFAEWSKKARQMMLRPNLLGNPVGLPVVYVHKLADDMRFFVDGGMRLTDYASAFGNWGTHGLNYYVLVKLLWDPYQDVDLIVSDYCRAAYGPGADAIREYYWRAEEVTNRIAASSVASPTDNTTTDFYTDEVIARLQQPLTQAIEAIGDRDPAAVQRVQLLGRGLEYTRATRRLMRAAADVREKKAPHTHLAQVEAEILPLYKSLALDWAVAPEQNYRKIKMGLYLNPNRRIVAADADDL